MTRYLLPALLLLVCCFSSNDAWAHHPMYPHFYNPAFRSGAASGFGTVRPAYAMAANPAAASAYGWYPGYIPMRYPGVGYVSEVVPGLPPNIYTQSYFNSPAYGHWNGFGN